VDVVLLQGNEVVGAGEVHAPVMVAVTCRRPARGAVDLAVGDGNAVRGGVAEDDVLARDQVGGDVVDPDEVGAVDGDGVAAPDVGRVDVGEAHVLDDNVLCVADDADALALDYALGALADQALVGADGHAEHTGLVVCDGADFGCVWLVVAAPVVLVDGLLAGGSGTPRGASGFSNLAFGTGEVEGLGEDDDARGGVGEVVLEFGGGGWVDWCCVAATGYAWVVLVIYIHGMHSKERMSVPLAKPSAAPLTPSAAATVEAKAAKAATM
jgi:hypothetical protein